MANAMVTTVVRRLVSSAKSASSAKVGTKQMADHGHGGASMYSNDYIHAPHMYNFTGMKHKRAKMGFMVFGSFTLGVGVPLYATFYQIQKSGAL